MHTKQTSKNVADTTFKLYLEIVKILNTVAAKLLYLLCTS